MDPYPKAPFCAETPYSSPSLPSVTPLRLNVPCEALNEWTTDAGPEFDVLNRTPPPDAPPESVNPNSVPSAAFASRPQGYAPLVDMNPWMNDNAPAVVILKSAP